MNVKDVTPEQIAEWKGKLKVVKKITVPTLGGGKAEFIIGRPTREILDAYGFQLDKDNQKKAREILQNNCILAGDISLFADDVNIENTVMNKVTGLLEKLEVEEEEL